MAVKHASHLDPTVTYQIDGLPDGAPATGWRIASATHSMLWFSGPPPARQRIAVDLERLYEVRAGHLHYVAT
jgi:hypothetical protein